MFIVSITYTASLDKVDAHIDDHTSFLNKQYVLGNFLVSGKKEPRTGGIIFSSVNLRRELDSIIEQDPFYKVGIASYDVAEFVQTKACPDLEFLLDD